MFGQDREVIRLLGGQRGGFFLDSGASNGWRGSNTIVLEREYGWDGVCVEPDPGFFDELQACRTSHCMNCCLYDRDGDVDFVEADVLGGIAGEYHPELLALARRVHAVPVGSDGSPATTTRPARTIRSVLRSVDAPRTIDYWSLDTEGSELTLLRSFPFDEYGFRVLTVEHNHFPVRREIERFLTARGYRRVSELAVDDCYVRDDVVTGLPAWRSQALRSLRHG
jgi:hypothetical protein